MNTLVVLDLKPSWVYLRACYDRSTANTLMIPFDRFLEIVLEAYTAELNKPGSSDVILEALVDFGELQPMIDQSDMVKREICMASNVIDEQLTYAMAGYFGVDYLGGVSQMRITPHRTLEVYYGKEVT